jgi:putative ABC transport system permease protein
VSTGSGAAAARTGSARTPANQARSITILNLAWRNLWRNRRRTWLTAGGVAFSIFIMVFAWSMQVGTFDVMIDNATGLMTGHVQVQHPAFQDDPGLRHTVPDVSDLLESLGSDPAVAGAAARGISFALVSADERSFGAEVMGVDPLREPTVSSLPRRIVEGRYLATPGEAVIGAVLARNLGVGLGDEIVVLGSTSSGGVAALAVVIVGIFDSSIVELDRSLLQVDLDTFRDAFELGDEAHVVAVRLAGSEQTDAFAAALRSTLGANLRVSGWSELMPELEQMVALKQAGQGVFFALLALLVTFSVFNTFAMTVFERTREFGMLLAIGMRPGRIMVQLQCEATLMCILGIVIGLGLSLTLVGFMGETGIPLGDVGDLMRQYHMPDRLYPSLAHRVLVLAPVLMFVAIQLAAAVPTARVRRMRPADELRATE